MSAALREITTEQYNSARTFGLDAGRVMPVGDRSGAYRVGLSDFEILVALINGSGYGSSDAGLDHVLALAAAADGASQASLTALDAAVYADVDPTKTTEDQVAGLVRYVATSFVLRHSSANDYLQGAITAYRDSLIPLARSTSRTYAAAAVEAMRADFEAAAAVVLAAHEVGIDITTTAVQISETGTPEQIAAWRGLPAAVSKLNQIADLRVRIRNLIEADDYRASTTPITTLVEIPDDPDMRELHIGGASNVFDGPAELVSVRSEHSAVGPTPKTIGTKRTGGPWLALVAAGYALRLAPVEPVARAAS